ncbi:MULTISPECIES: alpha/beta fold hydrolase [unclassified Psychrobacter]|uniref:alpha/beta fold hydrolase n=1 Tax=unclassified Psychrobacter TaxID=196806 RepID=UPI0018F28F8F|nr:MULTISPECIES: alpha/beta hydrolase [unclassified Psychrobacter]
MDTLSALSLEHLPASTITGKPVLHFAHANGMPSAVYAPLFAKLEPFFTIEYIERLGTHPNYPVDNHWQRLTQQVVDSIAQARAKHGVAQVVALGHSLGALCTLQALYKAPESVAQAVLLDPPWIYGKTSFLWHVAKVTDKLPMMNHRLMDKLSPAGVSKHRRDVWASRDEAYEKLRHKGFFKDFDERSFQGYIEHGLDERVDGRVTLAIPKAVEVAVFRTNPSWYWLKPNEAPKPPVTLIIGEESLFLKRQFPQQINKRLGIPFETHAGGHMFPLEYPDAVGDRVLSIIAKQLAAAV